MYEKEEEQWVGWNAAGATEWLCCGTSVLVPTTTTTTTATTKPFNIDDDTGNDPPKQYNHTCRVPTCEIDFSEDTEKRLCRFYGDPHWRTFDGKKYDFYGHGNYWLVKSPDVWIQGHYTPRWLNRPGRTWTSKIAFGGPFLKGNTLMIEGKTAWWNDKKGILNFAADSTWSSPDYQVSASFQSKKRTITVLLHPEIKVVIALAPYTHRGYPVMPVFNDVHLGMRYVKEQEGQCGDGKGSVKDYKSAVKYKVDPAESLLP